MSDEESVSEAWWSDADAVASVRASESLAAQTSTAAPISEEGHLGGYEGGDNVSRLPGVQNYLGAINQSISQVEAEQTRERRPLMRGLTAHAAKVAASTGKASSSSAGRQLMPNLIGAAPGPRSSSRPLAGPPSQPIRARPGMLGMAVERNERNMMQLLPNETVGRQLPPVPRAGAPSSRPGSAAGTTARPGSALRQTSRPGSRGGQPQMMVALPAATPGELTTNIEEGIAPVSLRPGSSRSSHRQPVAALPGFVGPASARNRTPRVSAESITSAISNAKSHSSGGTSSSKSSGDEVQNQILQRRQRLQARLAEFGNINLHRLADRLAESQDSSFVLRELAFHGRDQ